MMGWIISFALVFALWVYLFGRFMTPMRYRIQYPKWDKFLCSIESHRCTSTCGCCWTCLRCEAEKKGALEAHYEQANKVLAARAR